MKTWRLALLGWCYGGKQFFFPHTYFSIKHGFQIRFREDKWLDNATLREQYPAFYNIVRHKSNTLAKVVKNSPP
jgi:hypothetical protein